MPVSYSKLGIMALNQDNELLFNLEKFSKILHGNEALLNRIVGIESFKMMYPSRFKFPVKVNRR